MADKGSILIMDDDEVIRKMLNAMMSVIGYKAILTADGTEAIKKFTEAKEAGQPFDAVILDLTIPGGIGGIETIRKMLEIDPGTKAIVSSGHTNDPIMTEYKKYGFGAVATKPYSIDQMEETLHNLLEVKA
jgi:two-component system cell cycle sensor histidine kinase/response regulator CckA